MLKGFRDVVWKGNVIDLAAAPAPAPGPSPQEQLLTEIRDLLKQQKK